MKNAKYTRETISTALKMAFPSVIESFFVAFAGLIDSLMVSKLGTNAVASVGLTTQPKFMGLSIFFAINVSVSALVARRFGEKKQESGNNILCSALFLVLVLATILSVLFVVFASPIISLCGSTAETHDGAVQYFQIIMGGMIFNCIQMVISSSLRGIGNTKVTMRTNITSALVNIVFNYLLIGGNLGFPAWGIRGAAIATVLGTVVSSIMSIVSIMNKNAFISIPYIINNKVKPSLLAIKNIIKVGYGIFFEQALMRIGFMLTAIMAANQGTGAMAAHQVGMNLLGLSFSIGDGLQAAAVALIGRSLGEKKPDLARQYGSSCQVLGGIGSIVLAIVYLFGSRFLMGLYFDETEIVNMGVSIMNLSIIILLFQIRQVIYMGCLRGAGDTLFTAAVSTFSVTLVRTVFSYVCCYTLGFGLVGIWMGILADQISRFTFASIRFKAGKWINIKI
ncbi:MAG: MATE family efflux transporter [Eubacteriales bacterium]|nr:MATE family efflux transporter [Eubacteriales bacterium]